MNQLEENRPEMEKLHTGDTIRTFKGHYIDVFNPDPASIDIEDIAHGLSQVCRFAGHTPKLYTVAQHSIDCYETLKARGAVDKKILLTMLMHDATEAYMGDMARPIKRRLPQYKAAEDVLMSAIAEKFDLYFPFPPVVKEIDNFILEKEHNFVILKKGYVNYMDPRTASGTFMYIFQKLRDGVLVDLDDM